MKQITPEIKARVFALYWGQPIINAEGLTKLKRMDELNPLHEGDFLVVKPLSSITDEDAIEVASICRILKGPDEGKRIVSVVFENSTDFIGKYIFQYSFLPMIELCDYLRSKGYALPAFGYSVDELVEAGVFKLKEVNND